LLRFTVLISITIACITTSSTKKPTTSPKSPNTPSSAYWVVMVGACVRGGALMFGHCRFFRSHGSKPIDRAARANNCAPLCSTSPNALRGSPLRPTKRSDCSRLHSLSRRVRCPLVRTHADVGVRWYTFTGTCRGKAAATSGANVNKSESHDLLIGGRGLLS